VHNRHVVQALRRRGVVFVDEIDEAPPGATIVFSAHGVSPAVRREAELRKLRILDATCPLVTKVHLEVARHASERRDVILIGHAGHPEVVGTVGAYRESEGDDAHLVEKLDDVHALNVRDEARVAYAVQTTFSIDEVKPIVAALRARFPAIAEPRKDDICFATQNRQNAVKRLAARCDAILVVGSRNSANSRRLSETASRLGVPAYLIDSADDIDSEWLRGCSTLGITSGASTPEALVADVIERLKCWSAVSIEHAEGTPEGVVFGLPAELQCALSDASAEARVE
jgi:4-hydroxy-3-methylbut-2-enyl diphosphate reductase